MLAVLEQNVKVGQSLHVEMKWSMFDRPVILSLKVRRGREKLTVQAA